MNKRGPRRGLCQRRRFLVEPQRELRASTSYRRVILRRREIRPPCGYLARREWHELLLLMADLFVIEQGLTARRRRRRRESQRRCRWSCASPGSGPAEIEPSRYCRLRSENPRRVMMGSGYDGKR